MCLKFRLIEQKISIVSHLIWIPYIFTILWLTIFNRESKEIRYELMPFWEYRKLFSGKIELLYDILGNILLFIPFGFMLPIIFKKCQSIKVLLLTGLFFSISIELVQLVTARGLCEFDDVFNNTLGAVIGYGFYYLTNKFLSRRQ